MVKRLNEETRVPKTASVNNTKLVNFEGWAVLSAVKMNRNP